MGRIWRSVQLSCDFELTEAHLRYNERVDGTPFTDDDIKKNEEAYEFRDGIWWFRTNDLVEIDENGLIKTKVRSHWNSLAADVRSPAPCTPATCGFMHGFLHLGHRSGVHARCLKRRPASQLDERGHSGRELRPTPAHRQQV